MSPRVVVCCGLGGVGKTTAAAALALAHAKAGRRVVVLTIDPARRLADALGLAGLGNDPIAVDLSSLDLPGTVHALMLDRKATFDDLVRKHADPGSVDRLLENRYYRAASTRLGGSHEYMAIVKLEDLVRSGRWDVVILDTPPAQHVVDFFRAPDRMASLFEPGTLSTLTGRGGLLGLATRRVATVLERLAGESVIRDVGEFFRLMSGLGTTIRAHASAMRELLRSDRTGFLLVVAPRADALPDVTAFAEVLRAEQMHIHGLIVNRVVLPPRLSAPLTLDRLPPAPAGVPAEGWRDLGEALVALPQRVDQLAREHSVATSRLSGAAEGVPVAVLPEVPGGVRTLDTLARLVPFLPT